MNSTISGPGFTALSMRRWACSSSTEDMAEISRVADDAATVSLLVQPPSCNSTGNTARAASCIERWCAVARPGAGRGRFRMGPAEDHREPALRPLRGRCRAQSVFPSAISSPCCRLSREPGMSFAMATGELAARHHPCLAVAASPFLYAEEAARHGAQGSALRNADPPTLAAPRLSLRVAMTALGWVPATYAHDRPAHTRASSPPGQSRRMTVPPASPRVLAIATVLPPQVCTREQSVAIAGQVYHDQPRLLHFSKRLLMASGIEKRAHGDCRLRAAHGRAHLPFPVRATFAPSRPPRHATISSIARPRRSPCKPARHLRHPIGEVGSPIF